jgi:hypothetical protein
MNWFIKKNEKSPINIIEEYLYMVFDLSKAEPVFFSEELLNILKRGCKK